jgi:hypothetical protein
VTPAQFFRDVVALLQDADVQFMIAGSFASSFYGEARTTRDLDVVVELFPQHIERLDNEVDRTRWYLDAQSLRDAATQHSMCNLIDTRSGWKADLIVVKERPFSREEFARRRPVELFGADVSIATVEDVILSKLEWSALGSSQRQLDDVLGIVGVQRSALDVGYLRRWASELGILGLLERCLA